MPFPKELHDGFTAAEINFLAENETVEIISNVQSMGDALPLITTTLPKLRLMTSYRVPVWLAVILRKQNKVTVSPPRWLNEKYLANKYQEEVNYPAKFSALPKTWLETAKVFLKHFQQDLIDDGDVILKYIQDLREIRLVKLRKGLRNVNEVNLSFNDLSLMEINEFRPFISEVMGNLSRLQSAVEDQEAPGAENEGYGDEEDEDEDVVERSYGGKNGLGSGSNNTKLDSVLRDTVENGDEGGAAGSEDDEDMDHAMNEFEL